MKKIITLRKHFISNVSLVGALLFGVFLLNACSKSNGPDEKIRQQLVISASSTDVMVGDEVTFVATADGKAIDADIYIEGTKINGTKYTFDDVGTYQAVAKKANYADSKPVTITVKKPLQKVAKLKFNKVNTAPYTPAYGAGWSKMTMSTTHVYTYSHATKKFKRYSMADDKWEELNYDGQLDFAGVDGKMLYARAAVQGQDLIFSLANNRMHAYYPKETGGGLPLRDAWHQTSVARKYIDGERAGAVLGKHLYYVGNEREDDNGRNIDRYDINENKWETLAQMPVTVNQAQTAIYNNKLYILGWVKHLITGEGSRAFYVFDTEQLTLEKLPVPALWEKNNINSRVRTGNQQHLIAFNDYILFYDSQGGLNHRLVYIYDIAANQWLEKPIDTITGMFDSVGYYMDFMSPSSDKLYAAGTKGGNFILYELDFTVVEE